MTEAACVHERSEVGRIWQVGSSVSQGVMEAESRGRYWLWLLDKRTGIFFVGSPSKGPLCIWPSASLYCQTVCYFEQAHSKP